MEAIIVRLLEPDSETIEVATRELKAALTSPEAIHQLCHVLGSPSCSVPVRQYAAVLLRQRLVRDGPWRALSSDVRDMLRRGCLSSLEAGELGLRSALIPLVGVLAAREAWPELGHFLGAGLARAELAPRRLALAVLVGLSQAVGPQITADLARFQPFLAQALAESDLETGLHSLAVLQHLLHHVGSAEVRFIQPLLPPVLSRIHGLARSHPTETGPAMEIFDALFECEVPLVAPHVEAIVELCLAMTSEVALPDELRVKAMACLGRLVRLKKKAVLARRLHGPMIRALFPIMCHIPDDPLEDDLNEADQPATCACQVLDCLAVQLPPEKFMPHLLKLIQPALQPGSPPEALKGAYNALAVIAEGCSEHIRTKYLVDFLAAIGQGIQHECGPVQNAALYALGQFSEYLQPEINGYAERILPVLLQCLDSGPTDQGLQDRIFYALEIFCENLEGPQLLPFLTELIHRLLPRIQDGASARTQELAISALGAVAHGVGAEILPYFQPIMDRLKVFLHGTELTLLTQSMDTLGTLARAVGPTGFVPTLAQECCQLSLDLVGQYDDPDVRKCAFAMLASVTFVVKDEIGPVLPRILDLMIRSVESQEGITIGDGDDDLNDIHVPLDDLSEDEDTTLDTTSTAFKTINVENAFTEEKEQAVLALKEICRHAPLSFYPYLQQSLTVVWDAIEFPDEDVRKAVVEALAEFTRCYFKQGTPQGQEAFSNAINTLMPKLCLMVEADPEAAVVATCLDQIAYLLKECRGAVAGHAPGYPEMIVKCVQLVMRSECACMDSEDLVGEAEAEDMDSEQDDILFEYAGEVLPALGNAMSPSSFSPYFAGLLPHLLKKTKKKCTISERSFGAGSLAECMRPLQGVLEPYVHTLFPTFLNLLKDEDDDVRNNAIFGLGELALRGGACVYDKFPTILHSLANLVAHEEHPRVRDQIVGAVCRLIVANIELVPVDDVMPVILQNLPLKEDKEEYTIVLQALLVVYSHPLVQGNVAKVMEVAVLGHENNAEPENKDLAKTLLTTLSREMAQEFAQTLHQIPKNIAEDIAKIVQ